MFKKKKNEKKEQFIDNGVTIADMNVKGMPWYRSEKDIIRKKALVDLGITGKERRAMVWGAFLAYLPLLAMVAIGFTLTFALMYLFMLLIR